MFQRIVKQGPKAILFNSRQPADLERNLQLHQVNPEVRQILRSRDTNNPNPVSNTYKYNLASHGVVGGEEFNDVIFRPVVVNYENTRPFFG